MSGDAVLETDAGELALPAADGVRPVAGSRRGAAGWIGELVRSSAGAMAGKSALALMDQVVASGTNFLTTVILGRVCLEEQLGIYTMGFSLVIMLMSVPSALVWLPYTALSPHMKRRELDLYTGSVTLQMAGVSAVVCVGLVITAAIGAAIPGGLPVGSLFWFLSVAASLMLFREFVRRIFLARLEVRSLVVFDAAVGLLQVGGLLFLAWADLLSAMTAFVVIAAACLTAASAWLISMRGRIALNWRSIWPDARRHWGFGSWLLLASLVAAISNGAYPWLLTALDGAAAAGVFAAALSLVYFANPILIGVSNIFAPLASQTYARQGAAGLSRLVRWSCLGLIVAISPLFVLAALWGDRLVALLYGPQFAGLGAVVIAVALSLLLDTTAVPLNFALIALGRSDYSFKVSMVKLIVTATLGVWLIRQYGPLGAGYSCLAAGVPSLTLQWAAFQKIVFDKKKQRIRLA